MNRIMFRADDEYFKKIKIYCAEQGVTMTKFIKDLINQEFERIEKSNKNKENN